MQTPTDAPRHTVAVDVDYGRIEELVRRMRQEDMSTRVPAPSFQQDPLVLRAEYQVALDLIKAFMDIRFRCLVFVTSIATIANAILPFTGEIGARVALGSFGLLATLGITVYELRNSQLYEAALHRAKVIETQLRDLRSDSGAISMGLFTERPLYTRTTSSSTPKQTLMTFGGVQVKHDRGLALIYGAALGSWSYLALFGLLMLPVPSRAPWPAGNETDLRFMALVVSAAICVLAILRFNYHDAHRSRPITPTSGEAKATEHVARHHA